MMLSLVSNITLLSLHLQFEHESKGMSVDLQPTNKGLKLQCRNLGDWGADAVAEIVKHNASVTELDLSNNNIGCDGAKTLAEVLHNNTSVKRLYLCRNTIGDEGAKALLLSLGLNSALSKMQFHFKHSFKDVRPCEVLMEPQQGSAGTKLHCLNFGNWAASVVAETLKHNVTIIHLHLRISSITDEGGIALLSLLEANTTLKRLDCFSAHLKDSTSFARHLATIHHRRPEADVRFARCAVT